MDTNTPTEETEGVSETSTKSDLSIDLALTTPLSFNRKEFNIASAILTTMLLLFMVYVFKNSSITLDRDSMWNLVGYTGSFAALCIALPHFLKDFTNQDTLYRAFLLLSLLYTVATIVGIITLIFITDTSYNIYIDSALPNLIIAPIALRILLSITDLIPSKKPDGFWTFDHYKVVELLIVLLVVFSSLPYSKGESAALILMVLYASTYFLSLISALLIHLMFGSDSKKKA
jgi:hypothetical protein